MRKINELKEVKSTEIERENRILLEKIQMIFMDKKPKFSIINPINLELLIKKSNSIKKRNFS